jgi:hypothetical protein
MPSNILRSPPRRRGSRLWVLGAWLLGPSFRGDERRGGWSEGKNRPILKDIMPILRAHDKPTSKCKSWFPLLRKML